MLSGQPLWRRRLLRRRDLRRRWRFLQRQRRRGQMQERQLLGLRRRRAVVLRPGLLHERRRLQRHEHVRRVRRQGTAVLHHRQFGLRFFILPHLDQDGCGVQTRRSKIGRNFIRFAECF